MCVKQFTFNFTDIQTIKKNSKNNKQIEIVCQQMFAYLLKVTLTRKTKI